MNTCPHVYLALPLLLLYFSPSFNAKLQPGWRVVQESRCQNEEDDYLCDRLAASGFCEGRGDHAEALMSQSGQNKEAIALEALARCRSSCANHYSNSTQALPDLVA